MLVLQPLASDCGYKVQLQQHKAKVPEEVSFLLKITKSDRKIRTHRREIDQFVCETRAITLGQHYVFCIRLQRSFAFLFDSRSFQNVFLFIPLGSFGQRADHLFLTY